VQRTDFASIDCSIAKTMAVLGESWMALILRDLFIGVSRFELLNSHLGVSRKVLTERLGQLVEQGLVERQRYSARPARYDYVLTDKGWDLCDILLAMTAWGDRWTTGPDGPPATLHHHTCGHITSAVITCSDCGQQLRTQEIDVVPRGSAPTCHTREGPHGRL
jgi:DNA-binding HxlR family transcriptional regulator